MPKRYYEYVINANCAVEIHRWKEWKYLSVSWGESGKLEEKQIRTCKQCGKDQYRIV